MNRFAHGEESHLRVMRDMVRRNALANPATEFWGLKVLECFLWWSESSEIGRRVTASGIVYVVPFDQASFRGSNA